MSEGQKEAERRYPESDITYGYGAVREAFVAGAEWARDHFGGLNEMVTDAQVEAGIKSVFERMKQPRMEVSVEFEASVCAEVRGILEAAREVQG